MLHGSGWLALNHKPILICLVAIMILPAACALLEDSSPGPGAEPPASVYRRPGAESGPQEAPERLDMGEIDVLDTGGQWSKDLPGLSSFSISHQGDMVGAVRRLPTRQYRLILLDQWGERMWSYDTPERVFVSSDLSVVGRENVYMAAAFYRWDGTGVFRLWSSDGSMLFERSLTGASSFDISDSADVMYIFDRGSGRITFLRPETGTEIGEAAANSDANVAFISRTSYLLKQGESHVSIVDRRGDVLWGQDLKLDSRGDVVVSRGIERIAITTLDPEGMLYMFNNRGDLLWKYMLYPGGFNNLAVSADYSSLVVYNVAMEGGVFLLDAESGLPIWRYFLMHSAGDARVHIPDAVITPSDSVAVHAVVRSSNGLRVREEHYLVGFNRGGELQGMVNLGVNARVQLSRDASAVAVASGNNGCQETGARILNTITYFRLQFTSTSSRLSWSK